MRLRLSVFLLAAVLGPAAALLASCGGDKEGLIPSGDAEQLVSELDRVSAAVDDKDCAEAEIAVGEAAQVAEGLPRTVDTELRGRIDEGLENLQNRAAAQCQEDRTTTTTRTTPTVTQETTPTETVPPETTPTETVPPETTPTEPPPPPDTTPTEPAPPDNSGGTTTPPDSGGSGGAEAPPGGSGE